MENMDKKEGGNTCGCKNNSCQGGSCGGMQSMCGCGCHNGKRHLIKMILKIVIFILIFWCGFQLGLMTGYIKAENGRAMMRNGNVGNYGAGMMGGGWNNYSNNVPVVNPSGATPAPTK